MAMEELAAEGRFHGILDLATHEFADELMGGYCKGIGPERMGAVPGQDIPRLVVPGGLDCAVLEFTRDNIPDRFKDRKIFFYDFRSAIRLNAEETIFLAGQMAKILNSSLGNVKVLIPSGGWSEADREDGPLHDPEMMNLFCEKLTEKLRNDIEIKNADFHINDTAFASLAAKTIDRMIS
jgi:uncharacterized protein (UPF0261 family)